MKMTHALAGAAGLVILAAQPVMAIDFTNNTRMDFHAAGKHQFYVWCAAGDDRVVVQAGLSAKDAKAKLQAATSCRPVWQGRVAG